MTNSENHDKLKLSIDDLIWKLRGDITYTLESSNVIATRIAALKKAHADDLKEALDEIRKIRINIVDLGTRMNLHDSDNNKPVIDKLHKFQRKVFSRDNDLQTIYNILHGHMSVAAIYNLEILEEHQS